MVEEHCDFEAMAQLAADDGARQLSERIQAHARADQRARVFRNRLRWMLCICGATLFAVSYLEPEPRGLRQGLMISSVLLGLVSSGILFCIGGFGPERLQPTLTPDEKARIDNRLKQSIYDSSDETTTSEARVQTDTPSSASEFQSPDCPMRAATRPLVAILKAGNATLELSPGLWRR